MLRTDLPGHECGLLTEIARSWIFPWEYCWPPTEEGAGGVGTIIQQRTYTYAKAGLHL